ncbi:MAG: hypothetical protein ACLFOY_15475 [Desulfatibacillaceae bacterium]
MKPPAIVFTTDVNGTTTPDNTFAELVRPLGRAAEMAAHMEAYTTGRAAFADVLPGMADLALDVTRATLEGYAHTMPLFAGVEQTFSRLAGSGDVRAHMALSTTGFAGLMALLNVIRHRGLLSVAASPVLVGHLAEDEAACLVRPILREKDKVVVLDDLVKRHEPAPGCVFHVGDTLGDLPGLVHAAELGGMGVAFCPNGPLARRVRELPGGTAARIAVVRPLPGEEPDYERVLDVVRDAVFRATRCDI